MDDGEHMPIRRDAAQQAGASSVTEAASGHTQAYIANLQALAAHLAPGSALRVWLDGYIARLQAVPQTVTTTVTTIYQDINRRVRNAPGQTDVPTGARGGDFNPGWAWVGEKGPELVKFGSKAHVFTAGQSAAMSSGGGADIILSGPVTVVANNPKQLVDALSRHVRTNGRVPGTNITRN